MQCPDSPGAVLNSDAVPKQCDADINGATLTKPPCPVCQSSPAELLELQHECYIAITQKQAVNASTEMIPLPKNLE